MNLSKLLTIHAIITFAAGIVLVFAPGLIPSLVRIHIDPSAYLLGYLLAGSEFSLAALSYFGKALKNAQDVNAPSA